MRHRTDIHVHAYLDLYRGELSVCPYVWPGVSPPPVADLRRIWLTHTEPVPADGAVAGVLRSELGSPLEGSPRVKFPDDANATPYCSFERPPAPVQSRPVWTVLVPVLRNASGDRQFFAD